jgi:hypothetical protein
MLFQNLRRDHSLGREAQRRQFFEREQGRLSNPCVKWTAWQCGHVHEFRDGDSLKCTVEFCTGNWFGESNYYRGAKNIRLDFSARGDSRDMPNGPLNGITQQLGNGSGWGTAESFA